MGEVWSNLRTSVKMGDKSLLSGHPSRYYQGRSQKAKKGKRFLREKQEKKRGVLLNPIGNLLGEVGPAGFLPVMGVNGGNLNNYSNGTLFVPNQKKKSLLEGLLKKASYHGKGGDMEGEGENSFVLKR